MPEQTSLPPQGPVYADLRGKVAVVTGGGKGIGRAVAFRLAREGCRVVIGGRTTEDLDATSERIGAAGGECLPVPTDISQAEQVDRLFAAAAERFGPADILVNNAAHMGGSGSTLDITDEQWHEFVAANVNGAMYCVTRAARAMAGRGGAIINVSTVGALRSHYGLIAYDITKATMDAITRSVGIDLIRQGVRVNAVAPGATRNRDVVKWETPDKLKLIPIARFALAEEIAAVVAFLASAESSYIVAQTIYVDGGLTAQLTPPGFRV